MNFARLILISLLCNNLIYLWSSAGVAIWMTVEPVVLLKYKHVSSSGIDYCSCVLFPKANLIIAAGCLQMWSCRVCQYPLLGPFRTRLCSYLKLGLGPLLVEALQLACYVCQLCENGIGGSSSLKYSHFLIFRHFLNKIKVYPVMYHHSRPNKSYENIRIRSNIRTVHNF